MLTFLWSEAGKWGQSIGLADPCRSTAGWFIETHPRGGGVITMEQLTLWCRNSGGAR